MRIALLMWLFALAAPLHAEFVTTTVTLDDESDVDLRMFPAEGNILLLGFPCDQGTGLNEARASQAMSAAGIEVWMADLLSAHFLARTPSSIRSLDGNNVRQLIEHIAGQTDKTIVLATSGYGSVPVLRGARLWRQQRQGEGPDPLQGAILFYPLLNASEPEPGKAVEYMPVVHDTALNIAIFQPEKSPNRFWVKHLQQALEEGGSHVESTILKGVRNNFYRLKNPTAKERAMTQQLPEMIASAIEKMNLKKDSSQ